MKRNKKPGVFAAVRAAAASHKLLALGTVLCAAASVLASLLPPLLLARIIDGLTGGMPLAFTAALMYFGSLALEGVLSSGQETLLEIFGQKMTHALRSEMSLKLTRLPASTLSAQNPGEVAALLGRCRYGRGAVHVRHHIDDCGRVPHNIDIRRHSH